MTISLCRQNVDDKQIKHLFLQNYRTILSLDSFCSENGDYEAKSDDKNAGNDNGDDDGDSLFGDDSNGELQVDFPTGPEQCLRPDGTKLASTTMLEFGKLDRLFDLWDTDHNGTLDLQEIALGMRKFQQSKSLDATAQASVDALTSCDKNGDGKLDRHEFALLVRKLSVICDTDVSRLVDFMVVRAALMDTNEEEVGFFMTRFTLTETTDMVKEGVQKFFMEPGVVQKMFQSFRLVGNSNVKKQRKPHNKAAATA